MGADLRPDEQHTRPTGRKNLTLIVVGHFDGVASLTDFEQELDFGTDNYAFQAFVDGNTIVGIGWLANWVDTGPAIDFPTAMTLPRAMHLIDGALHTPPIGAAESLRSHILDRTRLAGGEAVTLVNGAVEILFELTEPGAPFTLQLNHPDVDLQVVVNGDGLEFSTARRAGEEPALSRQRRQATKAAHLPRLRLDRGVRRSRTLGGHQADQGLRSGPVGVAVGRAGCRGARHRLGAQALKS